MHGDLEVSSKTNEFGSSPENVVFKRIAFKPKIILYSSHFAMHRPSNFLKLVS